MNRPSPISRAFAAARDPLPEWNPSRPDNLWELWGGIRPKHGPLLGWLRINPDTGRRMSRPPQYLAILDEKEKTFVEVYVNTGLVNHAATIAGYQDGYGHKLLVKPRVAEAIKKLTEAYIKTSGPVGFRVLVGIAEDDNMEPALRFKAGQDLLNRAQGQAATEHNINITAVSDKDLLSRIESLQQQLGLKPSTIVDGVAEEIPEQLMLLPEDETSS